MQRGSFAPFILGLLLGGACTGDSERPDLESVSRANCIMVRKCAQEDFYQLWATLEECEDYSADEFADAQSTDRPCFDARLAWETCQGMAETCVEFDQCDKEYIEYDSQCFP